MPNFVLSKMPALSLTETVHSLAFLLRVFLAKKLNESAAPALRHSKLNYLSLDRLRKAGTAPQSSSLSSSTTSTGFGSLGG